MTRFLKSLLMCAGVLTSVAAQSMTFVTEGETLIVSGPIVDADLARMRDALQDRQLRHVLMHQSPGGDAWTGQRLGVEIRNAGLNTMISGQCASACGYMFLGGVQRRMTDGMPVRENRLLLHGAWDVATGLTRPDWAPTLAAYIQKMTGGQFPQGLMEATVNSARAQDFMEFAITPRILRTPTPRGVFQCLTSPGNERQCKELDGYSAFNTGVVTHAEIVNLAPGVRARLPN